VLNVPKGNTSSFWIVMSSCPTGI